MNPGLIVVVVPAPDLIPYVRRVLERQAICGRSQGGLPATEPRSLISTYGSKSDADIGRALGANFELPAGCIHQHRVLPTGQGGSIFSREGIELFRPRIRRAQGGWITWAESGNLPPVTAMTLALYRLRELAAANGARLMIFVCLGDLPKGIDLKPLCDLQIEVLPCDPEPQYQRAFLVRSVGHETLWALGMHAAIWSFRSNGRRCVFRRS